MEHLQDTPGAPHTAMPVIELCSVTKAYAGDGTPPIVAVDDLSLDVPRGDFAVITGRSGSGKTTLLNLMAGLTAPSQGSVLLEGEDLWALSDSERSRFRNERIGFVFQFPSLVPNLTALENVVLPTALWRGSGESPEARARELLGLVGLGDRTGSWPRQLSAGQQQRVVLARALIRRPRIVLADEPSSNLDEATELEIMDLLRTVHAATGVTLCMVTHTSQLTEWGTRSIHMAAGAIVEDTAAGASRAL